MGGWLLDLIGGVCWGGGGGDKGYLEGQKGSQREKSEIGASV